VKQVEWRKPRFSGAETVCAEVAWLKSSFSETEACVEVAHFASASGIRDSKNPAGGYLTVSAEALRRLANAVR
jgi:hypothetical protein